MLMKSREQIVCRSMIAVLHSCFNSLQRERERESSIAFSAVSYSTFFNLFVGVLLQNELDDIENDSLVIGLRGRP